MLTPGVTSLISPTSPAVSCKPPSGGPDPFVTLPRDRGGQRPVVSAPRVALVASTPLASPRRGSRPPQASLRVATDTQDPKHPRRARVAFARAELLEVQELLERPASARRAAKERTVALCLTCLAPGDTLLVSAVSRLGRSVGEIMTPVEPLGQRQIRGCALKDGLRHTDTHALQTPGIVTLCGLCAESERTLRSLRTQEALAAAQVAGKQVGRPRGMLGKSKLDGKKEESKTLLARRVSKASIAKMTGVDRATLSHFVHKAHAPARPPADAAS